MIQFDKSDYISRIGLSHTKWTYSSYSVDEILEISYNRLYERVQYLMDNRKRFSSVYFGFSVDAIVGDYEKEKQIAGYFTNYLRLPVKDIKPEVIITRKPTFWEKVKGYIKHKIFRQPVTHREQHPDFYNLIKRRYNQLENKMLNFPSLNHEKYRDEFILTTVLFNFVVVGSD